MSSTSADMNQGDPKQPKYKVGDFVHASTVPIHPVVETSTQPYSHKPPSNFASAQLLKASGQPKPQPFQEGLPMRPDAAYMITKIDKAENDRENHIYHIEPVDADKIRFQVTEDRMLQTTPFTKGQQVWFNRDTGREIVTVVGHTMKRKDQTYFSQSLKEARAGRPGELDMVPRILYRDNQTKEIDDADADKFSFATQEDIRSEYIMV